MPETYTPKHKSGLKTEADWDALVNPIPKGVVIITTDTQKFKIGDGDTRFSLLPDGPTIDGINEGVTNIANVLDELFVADEAKFIVVDNEIYKAHTTASTDGVINAINAIISKDTAQTGELDTVQSQFSLMGEIALGSEGNLVVTDTKKLGVGINWEDMIAGMPPNPIMIRGIEVYSDDELLDEVDAMMQGGTYFAQVRALHDEADLDDLTISLVVDHTEVTVTLISRGIFEINVGNLGVEGDIVLSATALYNADQADQDMTIFGQLV